MNRTGKSLILFSAILTIVFFISPACANARHRHRRIVPRARALPRISNTNDTDLPIHDGMLGLVPESFDEEDGTNAGFYPDPKKDSIKEFLDVCKNAKTCEECPATFKNSAKLRQSDPNVTRYTKCDALSLLNYNKLRLAQEHVRVKAEFLRNYVVAIVYIVLYVICIAIGIYLIVVDHFRIKTLWDKFAKNPAKGMRSARYQRMEFTFSYDDPVRSFSKKLSKNCAQKLTENGNHFRGQIQKI